MSKALVGAALGAGGAAAYYNTNVGATVQHLLNTPSWKIPSGLATGTVRNPDIDRLAEMVERLSREVSRKGQAVTIVHGTPSSVNGQVMMASASALALYLAYLRLWRGFKFSDMLYVTRSGLNRSLSTVSQGLEGVQQKLAGARAMFEAQVRALRAKQDEALAGQAALGESVGRVETDVGAARSEVAAVGDSVRSLETNLDALADQQRIANDGIHVLCRVVGDIMRSTKHRMNSVSDLEQYIRAPAALDRPVPGLQALLADAAADDASLPPTPSSRGIMAPLASSGSGSAFGSRNSANARRTLSMNTGGASGTADMGRSESAPVPAPTPPLPRFGMRHPVVG